MRDKIKELIKSQAQRMQEQVENRMTEMEDDDQSHHLIYGLLGIDSDEGRKIDEYQNKGRFLYKYAGAMIEDIAKICIKEKYPNSCSVSIDNSVSSKPKKFGIDCLVDDKALEIKWRDATTDGDHITKETNRIQCIKDAGYTPVRVMFFEPNRKQAQNIQQRIKSVYKSVDGEYYSGQAAWDYIKDLTDCDLKQLLDEIAEENK